MTKTFTLSAVTAAAFAAGLIVLLTGASEQVSASNSVATAGKGDRADIRVAALNCAEQTWPNIDAMCLKDPRQSQRQAKQIRVIEIGRPR